MAPVGTAWLASAVARVTGDPGRQVNEGVRFRVTVMSSDAHKCGVSVQVDTHPRETRPYQLNQIADRWHVDRDELRNVLENWKPEQLREHLEQFTKAELSPPTMRHRG